MAQILIINFLFIWDLTTNTFDLGWDNRVNENGVTKLLDYIKLQYIIHNK
jgi:hypothetical protein